MYSDSLTKLYLKSALDNAAKKFDILIETISMLQEKCEMIDDLKKRAEIEAEIEAFQKALNKHQESYRIMLNVYHDL